MSLQTLHNNMFTSNIIIGGNVILITWLARLLVPDGLVLEFEKLLICWDFHTQPSPQLDKMVMSSMCVKV